MSFESIGGVVPQWTLQDRLRKAREQTGMDASTFAHHVGISRNTVANYESGKTSRISRPMLAAWAFATGVPLVWLETGSAPGPQTGPGGTVGPEGLEPSTYGFGVRAGRGAARAAFPAAVAA